LQISLRILPKFFVKTESEAGVLANFTSTEKFISKFMPENLIFFVQKYRVIKREHFLHFFKGEF